LKGDFTQFFIVRVEDMYRLVQGPVPASRSSGHTFIYITEGEAVMKIGSKEYRTRRGELLMVPAGQVFSFGNGDVNKGYLCHFSEDMLSRVCGNSGLLKDFGFLSSWGYPYHIRADKQSAEFLLQLFKRLFFEYSTYGLERSDIIQPYLFVLLCEINQVCPPETPAARPRPGTNAIFREFRELVYAHFRTKHLVKDYAALLHVTPNHLNKTIKAFTGRSPTRWIDEIILSEAKTLLRQTSFSVSQVAREVGFEDQSYFARLFRKYEGVTPIQFRDGIEKC
jgi:AraC-like DNA-binding protein